MFLVAEVDIREPCVELQEDSEASPQASAHRCSKNNDDMGERDGCHGSCHQGVVVQETSAGGAVRMTGDWECQL